MPSAGILLLIGFSTILSREWIPLQLSEIHMIEISLNFIVPILDTTVTSSVCQQPDKSTTVQQCW